MRKFNITLRKMSSRGTLIAQAKGWFCTWPRCPYPKEGVLRLLQVRFHAMIEEYVIAEEQHADGYPHLHGFIKFNCRKRIHVHDFDLGGYHGNYQPCKSCRAVIMYCTKKEDYVTNLNLDALQKKQSKKLQVEDFEEDPIELLKGRKLNPLSLNNFLRNRESYHTLLAKKRNDRSDNSPVKKKRHEWLYGASNTGKTTLLKEEMKGEEDNWFEIPPNNDWNGYKNQEHLWMDEYTGQLKIGELNRICDGGCKMNTKGGTITLANDVIVHIISNFSIRECYSEQSEEYLNTLYNRFIENKLTKKY